MQGRQYDLPLPFYDVEYDFSYKPVLYAARDRKEKMFQGRK